MTHSMTYVILCAFIVISLPLALNWIPPNGWYGFRTPATLSDPELWRRVNVFAGWALLVAALIGLIITFVWPEIADAWGPLLIVGLAAIATVISFFYMRVVNKRS